MSKYPLTTAIIAKTSSESGPGRISIGYDQSPEMEPVSLFVHHSTLKAFYSNGGMNEIERIFKDESKGPGKFLFDRSYGNKVVAGIAANSGSYKVTVLDVHEAKIMFSPELKPRRQLVKT